MEIPCRKTMLCFISLAVAPVFATAEWNVDLEAGMRRDSNLSNAQFERDIASDSALITGISAGNAMALDGSDLLTIDGDLESETYHRYGGLNNLSLGITLALRRKWGLGAYAPWTRLSLSSRRLSFVNNIRDGWLHQAAIGGGQRISERWDLNAEYLVERRTAAGLPDLVPGISGNAFAQHNHNLSFNAEYAWNEKTSFNVGYLLRHGDVVATTQRNFKIFKASKAIAADPVFGPKSFAYKLNGTTWGLNVGLSYAVTSNTLLSANLQRQITHAEGENNYSKSVPSIILDYTF